LKNEFQNIVKEPATAQMKEETAHSSRARDVGASATLRSFACTEKKKKKRNGGMPVGHSGQIALRREQCRV
jgi:hypothetical protein